jgi:hypothetical protein
MTETFVVRRGAADSPPGDYEDVVRLKDCPTCNGRGWFLHNPFATGGGNGVGGLRNTRQCLTCLDCKAYWDKHGELPPEIAAEIESKKTKTSSHKQEITQ